MMRFLQKHKLCVYIFLTAFVLRAALFFVNFSHNNYELVPTILGADGYYEISQNLLAGRGFSFDQAPPYLPNPLRPPVWPAMIALATLVGGSWLALIMEMVMGSFIPVLGMLIARFIIGERAKYVGWILACLPFSILLSFIFYSETSFTFFFLLSVLFLFKYIERQTLRSAVWSGVFLGLAILIKPTVEYFPLLVPIGLLYVLRKNLSRKVMIEIIAFFFVSMAILAPWFYRNYAEFGAWGMSAQPSFNLYVYVAPTLLSMDNHTSFAIEVAKIIGNKDFSIDTINLSNEGTYRDQALKVIAEHKLALLKSVGITIVTFFTHDGMLTVLKYSGVIIENVASRPIIAMVAHPAELFSLFIRYVGSPAILIILVRLAWIATTILFIYGSCAFIWRRGASPYLLAALCIVAYFALTTSINGLGVNARFRVPVEPLIISVAIYGFFAIKERMTHTPLV